MNIIADTREQCPLWEPGDHVEHGIKFTVERRMLKTADYAVEGLEHLALIERKAGVNELASCCGYGRPRFERELRRMFDETAHRLLVIEAPATAVRMTRRSRVSAESIFGSLAAWSWRYGLNVCWAGSRDVAREVVLRTLAAVVKDPDRERRLMAPASNVRNVSDVVGTSRDSRP